MILRTRVGLLLGVAIILVVGGLMGPRARAQAKPEAKNVVLVGHNDLNGHGDGGEGLAIQQWPDGRRLLYLAHEGAEKLPQRRGRDASRKSGHGQPSCRRPPQSSRAAIRWAFPATCWRWPTRPPSGDRKPRGCGCSTFPTSAVCKKPRRCRIWNSLSSIPPAPYSRRVHCLWFIDGQFAHLTTGMPDFDPTDSKDDQFYVIVDLRDPQHPKEVGRWWYPGTHKDDACLPGCLPPHHAKFDDGYRPHNIEVLPDRPDRAYVGYIDGGVLSSISRVWPT